MVRLSILIPAWNGMPYLRAVVNEILSVIDSRDELIVSHGNSTDGTREFLESIEHPHFTLVSPPSNDLSMSEHWDWLEDSASGEWQIFLGQDDFLQKYYSDEIDRLFEIAKDKQVRAICARRAHVSWEPDGTLSRVRFSVKPEIKIRSYNVATVATLVGVRSYHSLPQMYTSSFFHQSLISDIRRKQGGRLIVSHPQDSSLAASASELEQAFLHSGTPISWVGQSKKSAGLAVIKSSPGRNDYLSEEAREVKEKYLTRIRDSEIRYPQWAGDFALGENGIYFWQSKILVRESMGLSAPLYRSRLARIVVSLGCFLTYAPYEPGFKVRAAKISETFFVYRVSRAIFSGTAFLIAGVATMLRRLIGLNRIRLAGKGVLNPKWIEVRGSYIQSNLGVHSASDLNAWAKQTLDSRTIS